MVQVRLLLLSLIAILSSYEYKWEHMQNKRLSNFRPPNKIHCFIKKTLFIQKFYVNIALTLTKLMIEQKDIFHNIRLYHYFHSIRYTIYEFKKLVFIYLIKFLFTLITLLRRQLVKYLKLHMIDDYSLVNKSYFVRSYSAAIFDTLQRF